MRHNITSKDISELKPQPSISRTTVTDVSQPVLDDTWNSIQVLLKLLISLSTRFLA